MNIPKPRKFKLSLSAPEKWLRNKLNNTTIDKDGDYYYVVYNYDVDLISFNLNNNHVTGSGEYIIYPMVKEFNLTDDEVFEIIRDVIKENYKSLIHD